VAQKKLHKVQCTAVLHQSAVESCSFQQNAQKDHCLPVNANLYQLVKYFFDKQSKLDTGYERCHTACEHDTSDM